MRRPLYSQLVPYYEIVEGRDWQSEVGLIASVLRDHRSKSIVDLGCGTGYQVRALTKLGFSATGIDISKQNIRFAKEKADAENVDARYVVGSYYDFHPDRNYDAALCLNWSIPVKNDEIRRFLRNTYSLLRPGGLLIFDFERISQIVWKDVGKAITESWDLGCELIVRVSCGQMTSNVLLSRDVYIIYTRNSEPIIPDESSRYKAASRRKHVRVFFDTSCVRFFSIPEIRDLARRSRFRVIAGFALPWSKYKRSYMVLQKSV